MFVIFNGDNRKINLYNADGCVIFDDVCSLKYLNDDDYILILLDTVIEEDGSMKDYNFIFEEIIITINVKMIITNIENDKLKDISSFYKIPLIELKS